MGSLNNIENGFSFSLKCKSMKLIGCYDNVTKNGGKIMLPQTLLKFYTCKTVKYPMLFQISNNGKTVHCGVLEFTTPNGEMHLPQWMMTQLGIKNEDKAFIKYNELPKGKLIQFQPHTSDFLNITDHKSVLEKCLVNFACLSIGDTIPIYHEGEVFYGDIIDCKPSSAIGIINCDLEVDFKAPKDYKKPMEVNRENCLKETVDSHKLSNVDCQKNMNFTADQVSQNWAPDYEYKKGLLSFPQDQFKPFSCTEVSKPNKKFIPFSTPGHRFN